MINPNASKNNNLKAPLGGLASNTRLILPNTTPTTTNKVPKVTTTKELQQSISNNKNLAVLHNHLDWLTINFSQLSEPEFEELLDLTGRGLIVLEKGKSSNGKKAKYTGCCDF